MLKFIKHHMDTISGIGIYPVLSFVIFFTFFLGMLWWIRSVSKGHINHMSSLPLLEDQPANGTLPHVH